MLIVINTLVFHISNDSSKCDDLELRHQYRLLCCRANSLIRKFAMCSYNVKQFLYTTYCSNISGVQLWHSHRASVLRKFIVCFNNAVRMFFGYDRFLSESTLTDVRAGQEVYSESPVSHRVPRLRRGPSVSVLPKYPGRQLSGAGRLGLTGGCHPSRVLIRTSPDVCYLCVI